MNDGARNGVTYFVAFDDMYVKIGFTKKIKDRLSALQISQPHPLRLLGIVEGDIEFATHRKFAKDRVQGEWFRLSEEVLRFIRENSYVPISSQLMLMSPGKNTLSRQRRIAFPCSVCGSETTVTNARIASDQTCRRYRKCVNGHSTKTVESSFAFSPCHQEEINYVVSKVVSTVIELHADATNSEPA